MPDREQEPDRPTRLSRQEWLGALRRTAREYKDDNVGDWAAALTYYGILSLFPALIATLSVLGLFGKSATQPVLDNVAELAPGPARDVLTGAVEELQRSQRSAGVLFVVGLAVALWSASSYVSAFTRAANAIYDVEEGRPLWKRLPVRLGVTLVLVVLATAGALAVVFTGSFAERAGDALGVGSTAVTVWDVAKWPALLLVAVVMLAILYYATPNAKQTGFRWVTPGSFVALVIWIAASLGFGFYVANFGSYNKTYGTVAGVIVFLVWLWISNIAVLLGAELDAELQRARRIAEGFPADEEPYVELRDDSTLKADEG